MGPHDVGVREIVVPSSDPSLEELTVLVWFPASHRQFSAICDFEPSFDNCDESIYLESARVLQLEMTLTLALFEAVRGNDAASAWLPPNDDAVTFTTK